VECTITPIPQVPSINVTKEGTYVDSNNDGITNIGDIVTYVFVVTNTGNVPLTNVIITDNNAVVTGGPINLAVGASDSTTFTAVHVITAADITAGQINNLALATGTPPIGTPVTDTSSDPTPCPTCNPVPECTTCTNTPLINAVNDIFNNVACNVSGVTGNILTNDTYGATPVNTNAASQVTLSIISGSNPNITIDANGNINLTSGIAAGTYTFTYQICSTTSANTCDQATVTINIVDTTAPVWTSTLPANVTVECSAVPTVPTLTASDTCSTVTIAYNQQINPGSCAGNYTIVNTWVASDVSGNQITHVQTITVQDTTAPTFVGTLPTNVTVECSSVPTAPTLTATDNCGTATVAYTETTTPGTCAGSYTLTRTWIATDLCGLTTTHVQTITVQDTTAPLLVTPLSDATATCSTIPGVPVLQFTDNCSSTAQVTVAYTETTTAVTTTGSYVIIRTWDVTDACGNASQFVQNIAVTVPNYVQSMTTEAFCNIDIALTINLGSLINAQFPGVVTQNGTFAGTTAVDSNGIFTPLNLPNGNYLVTYTNNDPFCPRIIEVTIPVDRDVCVVGNCVSLSIYNALTPNGDGLNDTFVIENITNPCYSDNTVEVFNRWGVKVYSAKNYNNADVVFKGESDARATISQSSGLPTGTYYYILKYKNIEGNYSSRSGYLYLTREN
jgi:gliding motility-associated-like protein